MFLFIYKNNRIMSSKISIKEEEIEQEIEQDTDKNIPTNNSKSTLSNLDSDEDYEDLDSNENLDSNDDLDSNEDIELDDNEYLENYESELTYGDILGQFLEDDMGNNVAENLNDLVQSVNNLSFTDLIKSINQQSKCIIKLQKTVETGITTIASAISSNNNNNNNNCNCDNCDCDNCDCDTLKKQIPLTKKENIMNKKN